MAGHSIDGEQAPGCPQRGSEEAQVAVQRRFEIASFIPRIYLVCLQTLLLLLMMVANTG
jgi:hypothetical protein